MGRAHFFVCFDILFTARVFSLSQSRSEYQHRKQLEFQHRKQVEIRVLRRSRWRLTQFSSVVSSISCFSISLSFSLVLRLFLLCFWVWLKNPYGQMPS
ncbi:hypothetical protein CsSME_00022226 [Camellia sinensis var. sinensis]